MHNGTSTSIHDDTRVQLNREARHLDWVTLHANGASFKAIADRYGVDRSSVREVIMRCLTEIAKERREQAELALDLQLERLNNLYRAHMPVALNTREDNHARSVKSADVVLRTIDRMNKLQGIDEPIRAEVTVHAETVMDQELAFLTERMESILDSSSDSTN